MKGIRSKLTGLAAALTMALTAAPMPATQASAASEYWKFDFGNGGTASGYTGVTAATTYQSSTGYGFSSGCTVKDVSASGSGALSDAVQFTNATATGTNTFCADVPNGLYQVTVWLGNTNRTSVAAEGMLQLINLTGNNATDTFQIPVTDGQLNLCCVEGKAGYAFTLSALEITKISDSTTTNPTIWICGDSTVCNYYPLDSSVQAGWGQMLPSLIDTSKWQVRNMAASGQYAAGFVNAGQFTAIETYGKTGDIYVISIGINDTNYSNAEEYYNVVTDMAKRAMAKGMTVILVKQQGRNGDASRSPLLTGRWFGTTLDQIGTELGLQVVDLFTMWQDHCIEIGTDATTALYMDGDTLHPNRAGATVLAEFMADALPLDGTVNVPDTTTGAIFPEGSTYLIQNVNSGKYLSVEGGVAANGTNVCQNTVTVPAESNLWKLTAAATEGEYYIYSMLDGGTTYLLDVDYGNIADGTNIGIYSNTNADAQIFRLVAQDDGSYVIQTKSSGYASCVEVASALTDEGANVAQWTLNGHACQSWKLLPASLSDLPLLQGDLNNDGVVNAIDATLQRRMLTQNSGSNAEKQAADVDGDLYHTATDHRMMVSYLSAQTDTFAEPQYPAQNHAILNGMTETSNTGFRSPSYVNLNNSKDSSLTFAIRVAEAGNYLCTFHIANGSADDRQMLISLDGTTDTWLQSFLTTDSWMTWAERALVLPLHAGINYITLTSFTEHGGPNIDYMRVAKTDEPIAETYLPGEEPDEPITSEKTVVYVASDSTAQSYRASYAPQQGWGYYLSDSFTDAVTVSNHAIAGRSSKSFYDNGRLTTILDAIKEGDYLIVCFGINDGASSNAERYAPCCGFVDNPTEGSFEYYMQFYIEGALAKGATPILMSPTLSIKNQSQPFSAGYRNIDTACTQLAAKYNIPYFDLNQAMVGNFNSLDYNTVYNYYMGSTTDGGTDFTHFTETGAAAVARIICDGIKNMGLSLSNQVS